MAIRLAPDKGVGLYLAASAGHGDGFEESHAAARPGCANDHHRRRVGPAFDPARGLGESIARGADTPRREVRPRRGMSLRRSLHRLIEPPAAAVHGVELQRLVNPPPEISVTDRRQSAETFPTPVVVPPFGEAAGQPPQNRGRTGHDRYLRGVVERLKTTDDCQQHKAVVVSPFLRVASGDRNRRVGRVQREPPLRSRRRGLGVGNQHVPWSRSLHGESSNVGMRGSLSLRKGLLLACRASNIGAPGAISPDFPGGAP